MSTTAGGPTVASSEFAVCAMSERPALWTLVWHPETERWEARDAAVALDRPFALAAHPSGSLYAAGLTPEGAVHRLTRGPGDGAADWVVRQSLALPGVELPCRVRFDAASRRLLIPGYGNGALGVVDLDRDGGFAAAARVVAFTGGGPDPERQDGPHAHDALALAAGIGVTDLGADVLRILDPTTLAERAPLELPAGTGPRHVADLGGGRVALSGELGSTLVLASVTERRVLDVLPATAHGSGGSNAPSTVVHDPVRGLVHVANRGADTILTARIDGDRLVRVSEVPGGGSRPEHLVLTGRHLLAVHSADGAVVALRLRDGVPTAEVAAETRVPGAIWIEPLPPRR
ncbi:lactonase family protein [Microbacterium sp. NPDC060132]|uniref:lactonase family protein n=1 Tax=unclassified Microbacterium TaxID=2609290 RepID=UPI00365048E5